MTQKMLKVICFTAVIFLYLTILVFAQEQVTINTYYPSPYGSYKDITVSERIAIGDVDGNKKVDGGDLMRDPVTVSPVLGSITVGNRLSIGRVATHSNFEMHSSAFANGVDTTFRILAVDPLPAQGGAPGPAGTNRSPGIGFCRSDGGPIGAMGMAGFYNAWTGGSSPGDFVLTTGNLIGGNFVIGTASPGDVSHPRLIIAPNGRVGIGGWVPFIIMPPPAALLDVRGQNEVILVPRSPGPPPATDPSNQGGAIYYRTNPDPKLGKFQVYENAGWRDMGVSMTSPGLPVPDYDSGWKVIPRGNSVFVHNLGILNTLVYVEGRQGGTNIHQIRYGGDDTSGDSHAGMSWSGKTATQIVVSRWDDDDVWQEVRIRMWGL